MQNTNQNETLNVPSFSFGMKAVIRPLPTSNAKNSMTPKLLNFQDIKNLKSGSSGTGSNEKKNK